MRDEIYLILTVMSLITLNLPSGQYISICTVKLAVKARSQSKSEGFAFDVKPDVLTIEPHKHKYVTVGFYPSNMMTYGGVFEATVYNGDPASKQGKLVFELRGEGTL